MTQKLSMKKLLALLAVSALIVSPTTMLIQPVYTLKVNDSVKTELIIPKEIKNFKIDWGIANTYSSLFYSSSQDIVTYAIDNGLANEEDFQDFTSEEIDLMSKELEQTQNNYIKKFGDADANYGEVITTLANDSKDFQNAYQEAFNENNLEFKVNEKEDNMENAFASYMSTYKSANEMTESELDAKAKELKIIGASFATVAAISAVTATCFWISSFFFNKTYKRFQAIALTTTTVFSSGTAAGLLMASTNYDRGKSDLGKAHNNLSGILKLGSSMREVVFAIYGVGIAGLSALAQASKIVRGIVLPPITATLRWLDAFNVI